MKPATILAALAPVLLAACANTGANYKPIVDGTPSAAFASDLAACQSLARDQKQFDQERLAATGLGAGLGAALGEAEDDDPVGGAVAGAVAGGLASTVKVNEKRKAIVINCMRGRGHRVAG